MKTIITIALIIGLVLLFVFLLSAYLTKKRITNEFRRCNVIVYGKKGNGKDLLFQAVINKRKRPYYANISYGGDYTPIWANEISVAPNTYESFINNKVHVIDKKLAERKDVYLSDGGIILPSQYDSTLYKSFPSFPVYYALSRHLSNSNVHINTQNIGRVWKALREQADYYIRCRGVINLPGFLIIKTTEYDNYASAEKNLLPLKSRLANKFSRAETDQFEATNGFIKSGFVIVRKKSVKYDSRAYHKIIYGCEAPFGKRKKAPRRDMPKDGDGKASASDASPRQLSATSTASESRSGMI